MNNRRPLLELVYRTAYHKKLSTIIEELIHHCRKTNKGTIYLKYFGNFQFWQDKKTNRLIDRWKTHRSSSNYVGPLSEFSFQKYLGISTNEYISFREKGWLYGGSYFLEIDIPLPTPCTCFDALKQLDCPDQLLVKNPCGSNKNCVAIRWIMIILNTWKRMGVSLSWNWKHTPDCFTPYHLAIEMPSSTIKHYSSGVWEFIYKYMDWCPPERLLPDGTQWYCDSYGIESLEKCIQGYQQAYMTGISTIPGMNHLELGCLLCSTNPNPSASYKETVTELWLPYSKKTESLYEKWKQNILWERMKPYFYLIQYFTHRVDRGNLEWGELFEEWEIICRVSNDLQRKILEFM